LQLGVELKASDGRGRFATLTIGGAVDWSEVQARRPAQELPAAVRRAIPLDGALSAGRHLEGTALAPKLKERLRSHSRDGRRSRGESRGE
jgi:hypothetical protein